MTPGSAAPRPSRASGRRRRGALLPTVIAVVILIAAFVGFTQVYTNVLWYSQLGFLRVFVTRNAVMIGLFVVAALLVAGAMFVSLWLAYRTRPRDATNLTDSMRKYQQALDPVRRIVMIAVPAIFGLFAASTAATQWKTVVLFFTQEPFGQTDPQFDLDLGFYMFTLPFLRFVIGFLVTALLLAGVAGLLMHYVYGGIRLHERGIDSTRAARVQQQQVPHRRVMHGVECAWSRQDRPPVGEQVPRPPAEEQPRQYRDGQPAQPRPRRAQHHDRQSDQ